MEEIEITLSDATGNFIKEQTDRFVGAMQYNSCSQHGSPVMSDCRLCPNYDQCGIRRR